MKLNTDLTSTFIQSIQDSGDHGDIYEKIRPNLKKLFSSKTEA